jgi:hypothetical protein
LLFNIRTLLKFGSKKTSQNCEKGELLVDDGDLVRGAEEEEGQVEGEGNRLQDYIMDEEVGSFCTIVN